MHRTWLITGISSGFGRRMTEQLLACGDRVAGTVRVLSNVQDLLDRYPGQLWVEQLNIDEIAAIRGVVDRAFAHMGKIDVAVSNAGYGLFGAAEEASDEQVIHQINTNLLGSIQFVRSVLPHFRQAGGGRILQLSTMGGQAAFPGAALYHASKWGIEGFIDALSREVAVFNIGCTLVEPGGARTDFRYASSKIGDRLPSYDISPASMARKMIEAGTAIPPGDTGKMVAHMIDSVSQTPAPKRLVLGSDAFAAMHQQLSERLADLESQRSTAPFTDAVD
ncbi:MULTISPECIES: SDR family oxidoreductase [unclassified Pseudomonas]|uniref:SDR family oxidoreductase n=1 Tax=unclassified Pseudomonas TaxID=196821 RepID=UPI00384FB7CD